MISSFQDELASIPRTHTSCTLHRLQCLPFLSSSSSFSFYFLSLLGTSLSLLPSVSFLRSCFVFVLPLLDPRVSKSFDFSTETSRFWVSFSTDSATRYYSVFLVPFEDLWASIPLSSPLMHHRFGSPHQSVLFPRSCSPSLLPYCLASPLKRRGFGFLRSCSGCDLLLVSLIEALLWESLVRLLLYRNFNSVAFIILRFLFNSNGLQRWFFFHKNNNILLLHIVSILGYFE